MSATKQLLIAIKARADGDTGAGGLFETGDPLITGWYSRLGPQEGTTLPYVVVYDIASTRDNVFETDKWSDEVLLQFTIYCDGTKDSAVDQTIIDAVLTRFSRWAPTITSHSPNQLIFNGENTITLDNNIRQTSLDFTCAVAKG